MGAMNENIFYSNTNINIFEEESIIEQDNSSYHLVPEPEPIQKKEIPKVKDIENTKTREFTNTKEKLVLKEEKPKDLKEFSMIIDYDNDSPKIQKTEINEENKIMNVNTINTNNAKFIKKRKRNDSKTEKKFHKGLFKTVNTNLGRGHKKNKNKFHSPKEIGNATKTLIISCRNKIHKIARRLAKNSRYLKQFGLRTLYLPTITKVTQIKNDQENNIGIFASHEKMRELIKSKLFYVYTDYTFPKRVEGDSVLNQIKDEKEKIKQKEKLLEEYKSKIRQIANIKDNDPLIAFFNLTFEDFLKIDIHYNEKEEKPKQINIEGFNPISLEGFEGKDWFQDPYHKKLRQHVINIMENKSWDK